MRPKKIRIVGKTYSVVFTNGKPLEADEQGDCNYQQQRLAVRDGMASDEERSTLLHEAIHAVAYAMNIEMTEGSVEAFESGLYALLVDNPDFVKYIMNRP